VVDINGMRSLRLSGSLLLTSVLLAQGPQLEPLTKEVDRLNHRLGIAGSALVVLRDGGMLHCSEHGNLGRQSVMPIAAASRWLAVATVLTLVDESKLDLDVPVARYVTELARADKENVTLRQCLSCTAGFAAALDRTRGWDMQRYAAKVADAALRHGPGERFLVGDVGLQVAAIAAERVAGKSFHELFAERIARPLGMTETRFGAQQPLAAEPGKAPLPWVAGGALSSLDEYARFVAMLLAKGRVGDKRVLSEASVTAMFRDQVLGQAEVRAADFDGDVRYGLGTWLLALGGGAQRATEPGVLGFSPWIDLDLGIGGVFAVRDRVGRLLPQLLELQQRVRELAQTPLIAGTDTVVALGHGGRERRYLLHVPANVATAQDAPLVLVLHGGGGSGEQVAATTRFQNQADREGFVVVFPDGTGPLRNRLLTWNCGALPVYAVEHDIDDIGFLRAVVADIQRKVKIDPGRVFAVGHSDGGMMCHRLAREAADLFAGIAVVAGAMNSETADSAVPLAALIVHGTEDQHVRYRGGAPREGAGRTGARSDASVQDAVDYYIRRNGLDGERQTVTDSDHPQVRIDTYETDKAGKPSRTPVRVITLDGGGHSWPGALPTAQQVDRPFAYDATRAIWDFLRLVRKEVPGGSPAVPR
jgi:polyhydroxybutyrate depolymerase